MKTIVHSSFVIFSALSLLAIHSAAAAQDRVLVLGNSNVRNTVEIYSIAPTGHLSFEESVPTGGVGKMGSLGSQGVIAYDRSTYTVAAANPGDGTVSVFSYRKGKLLLRSIVNSGGFRPISVALRGDLMYVVNQGDATHPSSVRGFVLTWAGATPIPSSFPLSNSGFVNPSQISFSPDGRWLAVTEKNPSKIDIYDIDAAGALVNAFAVTSIGPEPFGFAFDGLGRIHVSEAFGGQSGLSALTSYRRVTNAGLAVITPSAATHETAACWVAISPDNRFAFTTNTGSRTTSTFSISSNGSLTLVSNTLSVPTAAPVDIDVSKAGKYVHILNNGINAVRTFQVAANGALTQIDQDASPLGAAGLIVISEPNRRLRQD